MKNIKFRAWNKIKKRMMYKGFFDRNWYGTPKNDANGCNCLKSLMPGDAHTVELMQSPGILDLNGNEIYEGDIFNFEHVEGGKRFIVKFEQNCGCFLAENVENKEQKYILVEMCAFDMKEQRVFLNEEIIGNIYEHSNLLK